MNDMLKAIWEAISRAMSSTVSVDIEQKCGYPQASVIGAYVWNLRMEVLLQQLEARCKFSAYADVC